MPCHLPVSHRQNTVLLDIPVAGAEELFSSFETKLRTKVRRAKKEGVEVVFGPEHLSAFYGIFALRMRDLGTPVLPFEFFRVVSEEFGEAMWTGVGYKDGVPIVAGCGFHWQDEFEMNWSAALRSHGTLAPNMTLYWEFMERAAAAGIRRFDFGRCTPGGGTHTFKKQWNSYDHQLHWYQHSLSGLASTPSPDGKYSLGPRLWRHLPLGVANHLGPLIARSIP
jgi:hypothetical protein